MPPPPPASTSHADHRGGDCCRLLVLYYTRGGVPFLLLGSYLDLALGGDRVGVGFRQEVLHKVVVQESGALCVCARSASARKNRRTNMQSTIVERGGRVGVCAKVKTGRVGEASVYSNRISGFAAGSASPMSVGAMTLRRRLLSHLPPVPEGGGQCTVVTSCTSEMPSASQAFQNTLQRHTVLDARATHPPLHTLCRCRFSCLWRTLAVNF